MINDKEARNLIKRAKDSFGTSERSNFNDLWNSAVAMCRPESEDIYHGDTAGEKRTVDRYIDIGIQSLDDFTSGMTSTLIPKGSKFFEFVGAKAQRGDVSDAHRRWLVECSRITLDFLNESNFFSEVSKSLSDIGLIGTSLLMTEPCKEDGVKFKTFYINRYTILEDSNGKVDTVFFKFAMTARQLSQKFGTENLSDKVLNALNNGNDESSHNVIHCIYPRKDHTKGALNPTKQKYASIYLLEDEANILLESGFNEMPAAVCRWTQASNEIYGRSPAMQAQGNMSMCNQMEYTKLRSAQRIANPQWLLPDDGSVRNLNNQPGGIIYHNATNPNAVPTQVAPRDMPNVTDQYQQQKYEAIERAFYVPLWNPMGDVSGNTTASEINARMSIAKQSLVPKINRVIDELLEPTFKRVFQVLLDGGYYPEAPEEVNLRNVKVSFLSSAGLILRQIEAAGAMQLVEQMSLLAQVQPEIFDFIDTDELVKTVAFANAVPTNIIKSDYDVKRIRAARAKQAEAQQEAEQGIALADAYSKTNEAPAMGSPAEMLASLG